MSTLALNLAPLDPAAGYAERRSVDPAAVDTWALGLLGRAHDALPLRWASPVASVRKANRLASGAAALDDMALRLQLRACARHLLHAPGRRPAAGHGALPQALALVREAASRSLGMRPYDAQLLGAALLLRGRLAEMQTGEGKTLTAGLAAALAASAGMPVHVITVNDYLAERDAAKLAPLLSFLGLGVGAVLGCMAPDARRVAYACDVTYVTGKEVVFDYLKDKVALAGGRNALQQRLGRWVERSAAGRGGAQAPLLRGLHFAIVDEADSIFIDEARTPLILSVQAEAASAAEAAACEQALSIAQRLRPGEDFELRLAARELTLTDRGRDALAAHVDEHGAGLAAEWRVRHAREHLAQQALRALHLFHRDQQYIVKQGEVLIVDEQTGRALPGRTWEQGLHQMIEVKEGLALSSQVRTVARITCQRFFRRYLRLSGMTGTAREVRRELWRVYGLHTVAVPTHRPCIRRVLPARCLPDRQAKWQAVCDAVVQTLADGRPVLVGTRSVESSVQLAAALDAQGVPHRVLNAMQDAAEAALVASAGQAGMVTVATDMAGRGTDIELDPEVEARGGLHVILTEFHASRRVDRQLYGRAARQGQPGSAQSIVALDDELIAHHGGVWRGLLAACPQAWQAPALAWLRHRAQRRTERQHARQRDTAMRDDRRLQTLLSFSGRN